MQDDKPLAGLRVLDVGAYISGPYAAAILASLGADVVKVEQPGQGEAFRRGAGVGSPYFVQYNAGKRSLAVDLKKPDGVALVRALVPRFDVFIENARPGKMATLGLGPDDCRAINPRLIYSSASGFGDGGEYRDRAAYDSMGQSMGGFYSIMNDAGSPRLSGTCIADLITALVATMGILVGLVRQGRDPGGAGLLSQTSLLEAMSTLTIDALTQMQETGAEPTRESRHPQAQNFCMQTRDGGAVTLHLSSSEKFWRALARAMGRPELIEDPRFLTYNDRMANYFALKPIVEAEFLRRTRNEWDARLIAADVPFSPVLTVPEMVRHPQTEWLNLLEPVRDGNLLVRPPWRFNGQRPRRAFPAPLTGEHSREIAGEVLPAEQVEALIAAGVIQQAPAPQDPARQDPTRQDSTRQDAAREQLRQVG